MVSSEVKSAAREVGDHPFVERLARVGYAASGVLHLLLAFLAVKVAWSAAPENADQSGALGLLAQHSLGKLLLWVLCVGFLGLAVWQLTEAIASHGEVGERVKAASKFVLYAALSWTSFSFAKGGGSNSKQQTTDFTAELMSHTGGRLLVGAVGLGVVGVAVYHAYKGWSKKFLRDLEEHPGAFATHAGRIGYIAKGIALLLVGGLFLTAAWHENAGEATGLDGAMRTLREQAFGPWLLSLVALGLAAFGAYCFARARYAKV